MKDEEILKIKENIQRKKRYIYDLPINQRIEWLMELSKKHSEKYCTPEACLARERYTLEHPTTVIVLKCMDGRIHIPYATKTPMGIIRPIRNLGGMFNLGWPYLAEVVCDMVNEAKRSMRRVLIFITYHFSKSEKKRGCAGFEYDTQKAKEHVFGIKKQIEYIFGHDHQTVYPIICGFETDEDAMILHGENEEMLDLAKSGRSSKEYWIDKLKTLYPDMPECVLHDLIPLVKGNIEHISQVRAFDRNLSQDSVHREWIICIGRGFDFLHIPNMALIIGPYSPDLSGPIAKAAGIIRSNMDKKMISKDGFLLLASAPYNEIGVDRARAELKSKFLREYASNVIVGTYPEMKELMIAKTAVLDWKTRRLEVVDIKI